MDRGVAAIAITEANPLDKVGLPRLAAGVAGSRATGVELDSRLPLNVRLWAMPEHYGQLWLDGGRIVVPVMSREDASALLCLEPDDQDVRYVEAGWSMATLTALQSRIDQDWQSGDLMSAGIDVRSTGQSVEDAVMVLEVTVHGLTPAIADKLRRRYGDPVRPIEGEGAMPA